MPCNGLVFSTEEDFLSRGPTPPDGNPLISDGDLLVAAMPGPARVCARNRDLLRKFEIRVDLGLDAADVIDAEERVIAFSTELDDPADRFTAGDLLTTTGGILPNSALLAGFDLPIREDMGLDALHFVGEHSAIIRLLEVIKERGRDAWLEDPGALREFLKRLEVDIWFSTEGTGFSPQEPWFLDGDLLSARDGTIVAPNAVLLPISVPAGLPDRGVDFGLDAVNADREGNRRSIHYSTEILFEGKPTFTDGDVLEIGNGVVITNATLVTAFEPRAKFLGLDALSFSHAPVCESKITNIGGLKINEMDFGTDGLGDLVNAMGTEPGVATEHPHGRFLPFWGNICDDVTRFRVVYRKLSDGPPSGPNDGTGIAVTAGRGWQVRKPFGPLCLPGGWASTPDGWYDAPTWRSINDTCDDVNLTIWYTQELDGGPGSAAANDIYRVWLVFETTGGVIERESKDHFVQLDNKAPAIKAVRFAEPADPECPKFGPADMPVTLMADIEDEYFWGIRVGIGGDSLPYHFYPRQNYYELPDPDEFANLTSTGTPGLANIRRVNVSDVGALPQKECCYGAPVRAYDRSILGYFNPPFNLVGGFFRSPSVREAYFGYAP
jgi:hypothetical protein